MLVGRPVRRLFVGLMLVGVFGLLGLPHTAAAQMSARVRGTVSSPDGQPVEGATVTFEYQGGVSRQLSATTDGNGRYIQMGLQQGAYRITADKDGVGQRTEELTLRVGQQAQLDITLVPAGMRTVDELSDEERAALERERTLRPLLDAAVAAGRAGDHDAAVARFEEALAAMPDCHECLHGIGVARAAQEDHAAAEAAFERSLELNPDYAPAYEGLAGVYNAQRRFDEAVAASERAAELSGGGAGAAAGGDADAIFTQALINWNAGNIDQAKQQIQQTLELNPDHGEAHYWMGMANLNEGKLPEAKAMFERYLELEPDGRFAGEARGVVSQLP